MKKQYLFFVLFCLSAAACKQTNVGDSSNSSTSATSASSMAATPSTTPAAAPDLSGCIDKTWENGGDAPSLQFCEEELLHFKGKVGDLGIYVNLAVGNFPDGDSTLIRGAYYYEGKRQTIALSGYWNKKAGTLRLADLKASEFFTLQFQGASGGSGTWQKGDKKLACSFEKFSKNQDYDFLGAVKGIMADSKDEIFAVEGSGSQHRLTLQKDAEPNSEFISCHAFNSHKVEIYQAEVGSVVSETHYQRLPFTQTPTILYVSSTIWQTRIAVYVDPKDGGLVSEDEVPEGEDWESAGTAAGSDCELICIIYRLDNGKWKAEKQDVRLYHDSDEPEIGDGYIKTGLGTWRWDGERLKKETK